LSKATFVSFIAAFVELLAGFAVATFTTLFAGRYVAAATRASAYLPWN